jgi:hypothetical protein
VAQAHIGVVHRGGRDPSAAVLWYSQEGRVYRILAKVSIVPTHPS